MPHKNWKKNQGDIEYRNDVFRTALTPPSNVGIDEKSARYRPPDERFWEKVDRRGDGECWPWTGGKNQYGYGQFFWNYRVLKAHRVSYFLVNGKWPDNLVCHRCDNPCCVNPAHLYLGDPKSNVRDMRDRKRLSRQGAPPGEGHGLAVLTEYVVRDIRRRYDAGERLHEITKSLGHSPTTVRNAAKRITWKHLP